MDKNTVDALKKRPKRTATGEPVDQIIVEPHLKQLKPESDVAPQEAVITFGKFNPPHAGHVALVEHLKQVAKDRGAEARVYLSHSAGVLDYREKLDFCRSAFGRRVVCESAERDLFQILQGMTDYKKIAVVVGSDRAKEFSEQLPKYYDNVEVISFERSSPESSTALREAVLNEDYTAFFQALPRTLHDRAEELFSIVYERQQSKPSQDPSLLRERAVEFAYKFTRSEPDPKEALRLYRKQVPAKMSDRLQHIRIRRQHKMKRILDTGAA